MSPWWDLLGKSKDIPNKPSKIDRDGSFDSSLNRSREIDHPNASWRWGTGFDNTVDDSTGSATDEWLAFVYNKEKTLSRGGRRR